MTTHPYYTDDCTLPVPAGFIDRSTNVLEWKLTDGDSVALVIHREQLPALAPEAPASEVDLNRFVEVQTRDYVSKFPGMRLERDEAASGDSSFPMRRKSFRWQHQNDVLYHHQVFVLTGERVIVFTAAGKARHRDTVDSLIDNALAGFRVRSD
jgi:hypothetical protein